MSVIGAVIAASAFTVIVGFLSQLTARFGIYGPWARPWAMLIALLSPAAGLGLMRESFDLVKELPPSADTRKGFEALGGHYPAGTLAPVYVVVDGDKPITDDARLGRHFREGLTHLCAIAAVVALTDAGASDESKRSPRP